MIRFAHLADCHIGSWRNDKMRRLVDEAFVSACDRIISEGLDFVVIAGDLFNTALPGIEHIRLVTSQLRRLKDNGIRTYVIAGSHDYSPTGKTMLRVLEDAGLLAIVFRPLWDGGVLRLDPVIDKSGVLLCGISGRAGQLDKKYYEALDTSNLPSVEHSIFLFHTTISELKPGRLSQLKSSSAFLLPEGFSYYAGGHVHIVGRTCVSKRENIVYPGPLFPASFSELEELSSGGFFIVSLGETTSIERVDVLVRPVISVSLDVSSHSSDEIIPLLKKDIQDEGINNCIILIRLSGTLSQGTLSDIDFRSFFSQLESRGAYCCLKNTVSVTTPFFEDLSTDNIERSEDELITEFLNNNNLSCDAPLCTALLSLLSSDCPDGESKQSFEQRIISSAKKLLFADDNGV